MPNRLTPIARRLRHDMTSAEAGLWNVLRDRRLDGLKFRKQAPIAGHVTDFCCLDLALTIEVDGKHHAEQLDADALRREAIERHGYLELRFTNDDVKMRLDWVVQEILRPAEIARARTPRAAFARRN